MLGLKLNHVSKRSRPSTATVLNPQPDNQHTPVRRWMLFVLGQNHIKSRHWPHNRDDAIKWKHFPRYWPFVRGIHRFPVNSNPHKGQWRGALMFSLICVCTNSWLNNREAGDLRRYRAHYDVTVTFSTFLTRRVELCAAASAHVCRWLLSFSPQKYHEHINVHATAII